MATLEGYDETESAELVVEFLGQQAARLTQEYAQFFGLLHPLAFKGRYTNFRLLEDEQGPPCMTSAFIIDVRGKEIQRRLVKNGEHPLLVSRRQWNTFLMLQLTRIDWDEDPDMQGGICIQEFPDLTPPFIQEEVEKFLKVTFGCGRIRYFSANQAAELLYG